MKPLLDPPPDRVPKALRLAALVTAVYIAGVYLGFAEQRYTEAHYVGALFVLAALALLVFASVGAAGRTFGEPAVTGAWILGAGVALGMLVSFLLSRTVGLPGYHLHSWPLPQVIALAAETGYLALAGVALRRRR